MLEAGLRLAAAAPRLRWFVQLETFTMKHNLMRALYASGLILIVSATGLALAEHQPAATIPGAALIQPADLAARLQKGLAPKPLILQVGSHVLFAEAHIPAAEYAGPGGQGEGLQVLRIRVANVPKETPIVIYCGCCPWGRCPNIAPAYDQLRALGFEQLKVLYIADNFGANWVDQGYPVAKGD
jgi:thiosulfate/3-mercaptopyruvate sulfurtransferase